MNWTLETLPEVLQKKILKSFHLEFSFGDAVNLEISQVKLECSYCHEPIEQRVTDAKDKIYCSQTCVLKNYWEKNPKRRAKWIDTKCDFCGEQFYRRTSHAKGKHCFCSRDCAVNHRTRDSTHKKIRDFISKKDSKGLLDFIKSSTTQTEKGCWVGFLDGKPYPKYYDHKGKLKRVYRLVLNMYSGVEMPEMQVHHKCADGRCLNPEHLQYASRTDNMAEMFERQAYLKRIKKLEDELRRFDPENDLLKVWKNND